MTINNEIGNEVNETSFWVEIGGFVFEALINLEEITLREGVNKIDSDVKVYEDNTVSMAPLLYMNYSSDLESRFNNKDEDVNLFFAGREIEIGYDSSSQENNQVITVQSGDEVDGYIPVVTIEVSDKDLKTLSNFFKITSKFLTDGYNMED